MSGDLPINPKVRPSIASAVPEQAPHTRLSKDTYVRPAIANHNGIGMILMEERDSCIYILKLISLQLLFLEKKVITFC